MDLLEYQAMPSLRDVARKGVLCTHSNRSAPDRGKWCGPSGQAEWTVHQVQNHTLLAGSLSSSQPGGPPCWVSPLAFGLIGNIKIQNGEFQNQKYLVRVQIPGFVSKND
jgi:hypothetical protein